jgi:putative transposon-encoded protein
MICFKSDPIHISITFLTPLLLDKRNIMRREKGNLVSDNPSIKNSTLIREKSKFEVYGEEMIEKEVRQSGNSGRVYLPPNWVGKRVKIVRID